MDAKKNQSLSFRSVDTFGLIQDVADPPDHMHWTWLWSLQYLRSWQASKIGQNVYELQAFCNYLIIAATERRVFWSPSNLRTSGFLPATSRKVMVGRTTNPPSSFSTISMHFSLCSSTCIEFLFMLFWRAHWPIYCYMVSISPPKSSEQLPSCITLKMAQLCIVFIQFKLLMLWMSRSSQVHMCRWAVLPPH